MVDAATIVTSAGVAGTVTLLIEYAAKPHLDARKERILERHRRRRELLERVGEVALAAEGAARELRLAQPGRPLVGELRPELGEAFIALRGSGEQLRTATRLDEWLSEVDRQALEYLGRAVVGMGRTQGLDPEWADGSILKVLTAMRKNLARRRFGRVALGAPARVRAERRAIEDWLSMMRERSVASRTPVTTTFTPGAPPTTTFGPTEPPPPYSVD